MTDEPLTEEMVEDIYTEHLRKREKIPGYDAAFKVVFEHFRNVVAEKPVDQKAFDEAMLQLFMAEFTGQLRPQ